MGQSLVVFDFSLLRGRIRELYKSEKKFTEKMKNQGIKISAGAFNNKINGKTGFSPKETYIMCKLLDINLEEMHKFFFNVKYEFNS